jgi:tetratricopeptide (TPR) repeat protein
MSMAARPLPMSPAYRAMARGIRELHQLLAAGKEDTPEADAICDATDGPWQALSEVERSRVRNLSEDLYSLAEPPPTPQPMTSQTQGKLLEVIEARKQGDWDRALDLVRQLRANLDPAVVSYLRGTVWLEAGDPGTAALFFGHAANLEPTNAKYLAMALHALNSVDPAAAETRAEEILNDPEKYPPVAVAHAADITFMSARIRCGPEANQLFERLEPILKSALTRTAPGDPSEGDKSTSLMLLALLGFGNEFLGKTQAALDCYSRGLEVDPDNDALLVARGILLYGTSARAITDLERAIQQGTPLIWPYVFLAHSNLVNGSFDACRRLCEQALRIGASGPVLSEVSEWLAIALAELGFPAEMVRASFDGAIRLDPTNERAKRNRAVFEAATPPIAQTRWEMRTASAVRASGLAERRLAQAA